MRYIKLILSILLILGFLMNTSLQSSNSLDKEKLRIFLESQYVPEARLLRAATDPNIEDSRTIYIASDNLLASKALEVLKSPYAHIIAEELKNYNGGKNNQHDVLVGIDIPDNFYEPSVVIMGTICSRKFNTTFIIKFENHSRLNPIVYDWDLYADLVVYRALDSLLNGSKSYAEKLFEKLMTMWNGYGFKDRAFNGKYATYKLALAIYLYRALKAANSKIITKYRDTIDKCYEIIYLMQRDDGGIITNYKVKNNRIIPIGDANTETTSIVVLAIYSNYPTEIGKQIVKIQIQITHILILMLIIVSMIIIITLSIHKFYYQH